MVSVWELIVLAKPKLHLGLLDCPHFAAVEHGKVIAMPVKEKIYGCASYFPTTRHIFPYHSWSVIFPYHSDQSASLSTHPSIHPWRPCASRPNESIHSSSDIGAHPSLRGDKKEKKKDWIFSCNNPTKPWFDSNQRVKNLIIPLISMMENLYSSHLLSISLFPCSPQNMKTYPSYPTYLSYPNHFALEALGGGPPLVEACLTSSCRALKPHRRRKASLLDSSVDVHSRITPSVSLFNRKQKCPSGK